MRKLKFQLVRNSLEIIYTSFIRPLLEYSYVVWDNCTQYEANDLGKIQNEAARIVTGATKLTSLQSLYIETGWESLASRQQKSKLSSFIKCKMKRLLNTYHFLHLLLPVVQDIDYTMNQTFKLFLLNHNNIVTPFCPH